MKQINNKALMQIGYLRFYFDESNLVKLAPATIGLMLRNGVNTTIRIGTNFPVAKKLRLLFVHCKKD